MEQVEKKRKSPLDDVGLKPNAFFGNEAQKWFDSPDKYFVYENISVIYDSSKNSLLFSLNDENPYDPILDFSLDNEGNVSKISAKPEADVELRLTNLRPILEMDPITKEPLKQETQRNLFTSVGGKSITRTFAMDSLSHHEPSPRLSGINLYPKELFPEQELKKWTEHPDESVKYDDFRVYYDTKYNIIRITLNGNPNMPVNFSLDETGKVSTIMENSREELVTHLSLLREKGIIKKDLQELGIERSEVDGAKQKYDRMEETRGWIYSNNENIDIGSLPSTHELTGDNVNFVYQGEAQIWSHPKEGDALYTMGAGPCSVLIMVERNPVTGNVNKIGMAHIDAVTSSQSIRNFYANFENAEVRIISGELGTVTKIIGVIPPEDREKIRMNVDLHGERPDAVAIDHSGSIYYGHNPTFNELVNEKRMMLAAFRSPGSPLLINRL